MKFCKIINCKNKHHAKGLCKNHYLIERRKSKCVSCGNGKLYGSRCEICYLKRLCPSSVKKNLDHCFVWKHQKIFIHSYYYRQGYGLIDTLNIQGIFKTWKCCQLLKKDNEFAYQDMIECLFDENYFGVYEWLEPYANKVWVKNSLDVSWMQHLNKIPDKFVKEKLFIENKKIGIKMKDEDFLEYILEQVLENKHRKEDIRLLVKEIKYLESIDYSLTDIVQLMRAYIKFDKESK